MQTFTPIQTGFGDCQAPEPDYTDSITEDIAQRLIAGETVHGLTNRHCFSNVVEHFFAYGTEKELTLHDIYLQKLTAGDFVAAPALIQAQLKRAALSFAEKIEHDVITAIAEAKREDAADYYASQHDYNNSHE